MIDVVTAIDPVITLHDFRVVSGETHTNIIFDVVIPYGFRLSDEELKKEIDVRVKKKLGAQYYTVIQVDKDYNGRA